MSLFKVVFSIKKEVIFHKSVRIHQALANGSVFAEVWSGARTMFTLAVGRAGRGGAGRGLARCVNSFTMPASLAASYAV